MERMAKHLRLRQGFTDTVGKNESRTVVYERLEQSSQASAEANLSVGVLGLGRLNVTFSARLLNRHGPAIRGKMAAREPRP
jgi:hypothetical protein